MTNVVAFIGRSPKGSLLPSDAKRSVENIIENVAENAHRIKSICLVIKWDDGQFAIDNTDMPTGDFAIKARLLQLHLDEHLRGGDE